MVIKQFNAMLKARTMEFVRDRGTFFWNLLFPVVLVFGFAFAFSGNNDKLFKVAIFGKAESAPTFLQIKQIDFLRYGETQEAMEKALKKLRQHQVEMVLDVDKKEYWVNQESSKSLFVKRILETELKTTTGENSTLFHQETVAGKAIRYVDWLVPGIIGMNVMFSCLFGIGFVIVRYRKNGVLKRLKATPVSALNFVTAQAVSRLLIVFATCIVVFLGTNLFLNFTMNGSYWDLILLTIFAILCMLSLGLIFATRFRSEELVNGLMNIVTFPMMILSGLFFSLDDSPQILQQIAQVFPLTHFTDGARKIMLDGANLASITPDLLFLGGLTVVFTAISAWLFKWE